MENKMLHEEKKILEEIKKEESALKKLTRNVYVLVGIGVLVVMSAILFGIYLKTSGSTVFSDKADTEAPIVTLAPRTSGVLQQIFVNVGDHVLENTVVAQVGNELIKTKSAGMIVSTQNDVGKLINTGETVVSMIDPHELRVVARIDEDKGLSDIHIGEHVVFTVDTFGGKEYEGVVDEISPTAHSGDIVFSISDKRATQQFDVKIRFNTDTYSELTNGMSARVWIYKN